ncbi:MAG TPA: PGPGW domain-containing protein [Nitrococcus sp.]|nr:PGPGW domain-containing protein [Nitrococcus sp.]
MPTIDHLLHLIGPFIPWLIGFSAIMLLISVIAVPWVAIVVPADYFTHTHRWRLHRRGGGSPRMWLWLMVKNLIGAILVILGLIMLVAPGQGILTILIGLGIADFPGKYHLERRLVSLPGVLRSLNWIRQRRGRPPLEAPPQAELVRNRYDTLSGKDGN